MRRIHLTAALSMMLLLVSARAAYAGDVLAYLGPDVSGDNTVLTIVGDNLGDAIRITEDAPNHAWIEGLNGTTVNGNTVDELFNSLHVFTGASINLGNGDDSVEYVFTGKQFNHYAELFTGNGDDRVTILARGLVGYLRIDTGTGNDTATMRLTAEALMDYVQLDTGLGKDAVSYMADNGDGGAPILLRDTRIDTGQGDDEMHFHGYIDPLGGTVHVQMAEGDDLLVGDADGQVELSCDVIALGDGGTDTVINALYFDIPYDLWAYLEFEVIVE